MGYFRERQPTPKILNSANYNSRNRVASAWGRWRPLVGSMGATRQTIEKEHAAPTLADAVSAALVAALAPPPQSCSRGGGGGRAHGALGLPHRLNVLRVKDAPREEAPRRNPTSNIGHYRPTPQEALSRSPRQHQRIARQACRRTRRIRPPRARRHQPRAGPPDRADYPIAH